MKKCELIVIPFSFTFSVNILHKVLYFDLNEHLMTSLSIARFSCLTCSKQWKCDNYIFKWLSKKVFVVTEPEVYSPFMRLKITSVPLINTNSMSNRNCSAILATLQITLQKYLFAG